MCMFACVRRTCTLCLWKDYPVSAALGCRWNRLLYVQMFHVLSRGSIICWILCFFYLIRLSCKTLIVESFCCISPLCLWPFIAAREQRIRANPKARAAHCLWSQELCRYQLVLWEKVPLKCGGTEDVAFLWLTFTIYWVKKGWKCEMWGVNNVTALNISLINLYSRAGGPLGSRGRLEDSLESDLV